MAALAFFSTVQAALDADADLREKIRAVVKDLESVTRTLMAHYNTVHASQNRESLDAICTQASLHFESIRVHLGTLAALIPPSQFYRYQDHFSRTLQNICFSCAWLIYLRESRLATPDDVANMTGVSVNQPDQFFIPIEVSMSNELSRLAVTAVIAGDYQRPLKVSAFLEELYSGFQLLNLKNDMLRKRFDSMKYDIKKIEEVVYNISLRGLVSKQE